MKTVKKQKKTTAGVKTRNPYTPEIIARAKVMFVQEGKSALEIAKLLEGPSHQTISNWAKKVKHNRSWVTEREEYQHNLYANMSPAAQAQKIMEKINTILAMSADSFSTKDADALAKLQKLLEKVTDSKYQIPMMFELLTKLVAFLKANYAKLVTEEFLLAVRHFKNDTLNEAT